MNTINTFLKHNFKGLLVGVIIGVFIASFPMVFSRHHHMNKMEHGQMMMDTVTSEKQFLEDMIIHHDQALVMAEEVLMLNPSEKVKALAEAILKTQSEEIEMMQDWLKQ
jgi:uncharacterized protein (DUF305 family)